jgi:dihydrofolate reductase
MITLIAAADGQNAIGFENDLLCYLKDDLKHFKEKTKNHKVIMGRATWDSLPIQPLPGRENFVLTKSDETFEGAIKVSVDEVLQFDQLYPNEEIFIIGGAQIFHLFYQYANRMYLSRIHHIFEDVDTYFPFIDFQDWRLTDCQLFQKSEVNEFDFSIHVFERK